MKKLLQNKSFRQLIGYGLIGCVGLVVDSAIFYCLQRWGYQASWSPYLNQFISSSGGLTNNFFWNSFLNFKVHDHLWRRFGQYYLIGQTTTVFVWLMLLIFSTILKFDPFWVKFIATVCATLAQFVINKVWTFKK